MTDATDVALEKARDALWDFFCPAIRHTPEDDATYRDAAEAVVLAYLSARHASPDGLAERLASALCKSGKFETGQGTCAPICMEQLGNPRKKGCSHCSRVHGKLAEQLAAASLLGGGVPEGWRDISTAPKDGTAIDVWLGHSEFPRRATEIRWRKPTDSEFWAGGSDDPDPKEGTFSSEAQWFDDVCGPYQGDEAPTHWMPLPRPPESGRE